MTIVDAHVHLWDPGLHDHSWLRNGGEPPLQRSFGLDDLAQAAAGTVAAVVVQAGGTAAERSWLLDLAARSDRIAGVVVYGDLNDAALPDEIDAIRAGDAALVGLRDPVASGAGYRLGLPRVRRSLAALGERGLAVDLLLGNGTLDEACAVARALPQVRFVVDHAAISAVDVRREGVGEWAAQLTALGRLPNVMCKLSGLGRVTAGPDAAARLDDVARVALDVFGPYRLMFGSDWPVSTLWAPYEDVVDAAADVLGGLSADESAAFWGGTAIGAYGLDLADPSAIDRMDIVRHGWDRER